ALDLGDADTRLREFGLRRISSRRVGARLKGVRRSFLNAEACRRRRPGEVVQSASLLAADSPLRLVSKSSRFEKTADRCLPKAKIRSMMFCYEELHRQPSPAATNSWTGSLNHK